MQWARLFKQVVAQPDEPDLSLTEVALDYTVTAGQDDPDRSLVDDPVEFDEPLRYSPTPPPHPVSVLADCAEALAELVGPATAQRIGTR